jgi:radical SAM superfamily enzyme YgiQ (UPF0313 family)
MDFLRNQISLPLNLLHAANLVDREYQVKIIDQRIDKNWKEILGNELSKSPICVGVTAYTGKMIKHSLWISQFVKERSKVPIVWGGIHASLLPLQTLENRYIDIVVQGEGEESFLELVEALAKGKSLKRIDGICFKEGGQIFKNPQRRFLDLDNLPEIPYHLVDIHRYMPLYKGKRSIPMQTSRGCIYHCNYCYNTVYNKSVWRFQSPEKVYGRIKYLVDKFNAENIYFVDDNFFIDLERSKRIAEAIIRENINIEWQVQGVGFSEIGKMDDNYLRLLERSGCVRFTSGVESGSSRIREMLNKGDSNNIDSIIQINRRLSKFKIVMFYSFITGFPTETFLDLRQTINILFKLLKENKNARNSPIYTFISYPQITFTKILENNGYKLPDTLIGWINYDYGNRGYENIPYVSAELMKVLKPDFLYYLSFFLDKKIAEYETLGLIKILALLYRPIAKFRVKYLIFALALDKKLIKLFLKLISKYKR